MAIERAGDFPVGGQGLDGVRNAFRTIGQEGTKSFVQNGKGTNGATKETPAYTAALKRLAAPAVKVDASQRPTAAQARTEVVRRVQGGGAVADPRRTASEISNSLGRRWARLACKELGKASISA